MKVYSTKDIRNIVLVGHSGSGKTTLVESMLFEAGAITRRGTIEEENTISDHYLIEKDRKNSIFASLMHAEWKDSKINIIDTPGYDDFIGEMVSGLSIAGTAILVLNATQGVEVGSETAWEYIQKHNTPTLIAINQLDHEKADFNNTLEQAQEKFGDNVTVIQYPYNIGSGFNCIIDVLRDIMYKFPAGGGKPEKVAIPDEEKEQAEEYRAALIEKVAEFDEDLMESFFENDTLTEEEMTTGLKGSMLAGELVPIFCCSAAQNMGSGRIMGFLNDSAPAPIDRMTPLQDGNEIACDSNGTPAAFFYKNLSEPHLGEVSYFKVLSGTVKSGDELYNHRTSNSERIGQIYIVNGKNREAVNELRAGDIGTAVKLKYTKNNDTLSPKNQEIRVEEITYPAPRIRASITSPQKKDLEKLAIGLAQMRKEDPTLQSYQSPELKQTIVSGQSEMHLNMIKYRIEKLYGITVNFEEPVIPYRETIRKKADASYRHKKQSGGSGQFGEVHMIVEPYTDGMPPPSGLTPRDKDTQDIDLKWGGKLVFLNCTFGGSIDTKFMPSIMKGVMKIMENGPITGSYVRDIRVAVYDGKMHAVDSNDMAFQMAGAGAMKKAFAEAKPQVMEPIYAVKVLCTDDTVGDVMSDLNTRRAIITNIGSENGKQVIEANVPLKELYQYSSKLRAISGGRAKHARTFLEYQIVPKDVQDTLAKAHQEAQEG